MKGGRLAPAPRRLSQSLMMPGGPTHPSEVPNGCDEQPGYSIAIMNGSLMSPGNVQSLRIYLRLEPAPRQTIVNPTPKAPKARPDSQAASRRPICREIDMTGVVSAVMGRPPNFPGPLMTAHLPASPVAHFTLK